MTALNTLDGFPTVASDASLAGEIIAWEMNGAKILHATLTDALATAGFDPATARAMLPRNAFSRACKSLADERIIRKIDEDETCIRFQFTAERNNGFELQYDREAILSLDKESGSITADDSDLAERARIALGEAMGLRTTNDVSRLIHRLCDLQKQRDLDLIPIGKGGTYFVRPSGRGFVDQVERLIDTLSGTMMRLPIATPGQGTTAQKNIQQAVSGKIRSMIVELNETVDGFDEDAKNRSLEAAAERVKLARFKILSYREQLGDELMLVDEELKAATDRLRVKVKEIMTARNE